MLKNNTFCVSLSGLVKSDSLKLLYFGSNCSYDSLLIYNQFFQWVPPVRENQKEKEADAQIAIDLGDEYEQALSNATEDEIIDLAGKKIYFI